MVNVKLKYRPLLDKREKEKRKKQFNHKLNAIATLSCLLSEGKSAKSCIAKATVANTCHEEGRRDAKQTDAKMDAFKDADLETL